jgi:signal transduction histidine kinase
MTLSSTEKNKSLKDLMTLSWLVSGSLAFVTCAIAFVVLGLIDYRNTQSRFQDDLTSKSQIVARRLAGELLLGKNGAADTVASGLKNELGLAGINLNENPTCKADSCVMESPGTLTVQIKIPHISNKTYVDVSNSQPPFFTMKRFSLFLFSIIPIAIVLGFALALQKYFMSRYVFGPISSLVDTSTGTDSPKDHWPKEIQDISERLSSSFENREQAVFGQMARGVIHDVRTLLHSVLSATSLVREQEVGSDKRYLRLETLFRACEANLPKINDLVDLTLDGSREITVTPKQSDALDALVSAVRTNDTLSKNKNVKVELITPSNLVLAHDPLQLERVFTNLIKNAIESCSEKGTTGQIIITAVSNHVSKSAFFTIHDSGMGLPAKPEKVFRLLKSTKTHGSGLGLIVSRKIVEAHGGILIPGHSDKLSGAKFEIRLPLIDTGVAPC